MISLLSVKLQSRFGDSVGGKGNVKTKRDETSKEGMGGKVLHLDILSPPQQQIGKSTPALLLYAVFNGR